MRCLAQVFIERPWRSLKYKCVYLQAFETGAPARAGIGRWIDYYNTSRPHSAFDGRTPGEVYSGDDASSPGHVPEDGARGAGGVKIIMGSHLTNAAKLSSDWGPPQPALP